MINRRLYRKSIGEKTETWEGNSLNMATTLWVVLTCSLGYLKFSKFSTVYMYYWYNPKRIYIYKKTQDKCYKVFKVILILVMEIAT